MNRHKNICEFCKENFKNDCELRQHIDVHTPFWKGKEIVLSGGDQIRLMLKDWSGGWDKIIADEAKRIKTKGRYDFEKLQKLRDFEELNGIEFVVCGDKIKEYRSLA